MKDWPDGKVMDQFSTSLNAMPLEDTADVTFKSVLKAGNLE
jgi:hypothetical protein